MIEKWFIAVLMLTPTPELGSEVYVFKNLLILTQSVIHTLNKTHKNILIMQLKAIMED